MQIKSFVCSVCVYAQITEVKSGLDTADDSSAETEDEFCYLGDYVFCG